MMSQNVPGLKVCVKNQTKPPEDGWEIHCLFGHSTFYMSISTLFP